MILVRIELLSARTGKKTEIGRMVITNEGTGDARSGDYGVQLMRRGAPSVVRKTGRVESHARLSIDVWSHVRKAIKAVGL